MKTSKKIPIDIVLQYWQKHQEQTPDDMFSSLRKLYKQQYAMMDYLMKAEGDSFTEAEHQAMYFLGSFILRVMLGEFPSIPAVPEAVMSEARQSNMNCFKFISAGQPTEDLVLSMENILDEHPQPNLLRFVFENLIHDPYVQNNVRDENVWILFIHLKIVMDALDSMLKENVCPPLA